jgi:hypothetical protein
MPIPTGRAEAGDLIWGLIADAASRFAEDPNDDPAENEFALTDGLTFWYAFSPIELVWLQGAIPGTVRTRDGAPNEELGKDEFPVVEGFTPCPRFPVFDEFNPLVELPAPACDVGSCPVARVLDTTQIPAG